MAKYEDRLVLKDNVTSVLGKIQRRFEEFNKKITQTHPKLAEFSAKLRDVGSALKSTGNRFKNFGAKLSIGFGVAAAAVRMWYNKTINALNGFAEMGDRIDKMSQKIGMSRKAFQEWDYIMSQNGGSVESLQMGFKTLGTQMNNARKGSKDSVKAFVDLGVSIKDVNGNFRIQEDVFNDCLKALQKIQNPTKRAMLANQLFGRSAAELKPLLNQEAGAIEELREKANDLGLVLTDEEIDNAVKYQDTMDNLGRVFQTRFASVAMQYMPQITDAFNSLIRKKNTLDNLVKTVSNFVGAIIKLVTWFANLSTPTQAALIGFIAFIAALGPAIGIIGNIITLLGALSTACSVVTTAAAAFGIGFNLATGGILLAIGAVVGAIILLIRHWKDLKEKTLDVWSNIVGGIKKYIGNIIEFINNLLDRLGKLAYLIPGLNLLKAGKDIGGLIKSATTNNNTTNNNTNSSVVNNYNNTYNNGNTYNSLVNPLSGLNNALVPVL